MNKYYNLKKAMQLLGLKSANVFFQLERQYPEAFVNLSSYKYKRNNPRYDKAKLDNFATKYNTSK